MISILQFVLHSTILRFVVADVPFSYNAEDSSLKALDTSTIIESSASKAFDIKNFLDLNNYIVVPETKSVIVHSSKLDTTARAGATIFNSVSNTAENRNKWYELKQGKMRSELGPKIPISNCLSNEFGDGGKLVGTISTSWGHTALLDVGWGLYFPFLTLGALNLAALATNVVTISGFYECLIPQNTTGQILMQRYTQIITEGQCRELEVVEGRSWTTGFRKRPLDVQKGKWTTADEARINMVDHAPVYTCVTDPSQLMCPGMPL